MYVCNMRVSKHHCLRVSDPVINSVVDALADDADRLAILIAGPPGFGKTSVLAAAAEETAHRTGRSVVWISGGIVASEGHLATLLAAAIDDVVGAPSFEEVCKRLVKGSRHRLLLAVDDFDALVFKRESVAVALVDIISAGPAVRLLATCHPAACERLSAPTHPFTRALGGRVKTIMLTPFDDQAARDLIHRRAPRISPKVASAVIAAAGGHPAALVFLSRLAELREYKDENCLADLLDCAAEFAGAVYAESWASLGPQQRAILWRLSSNAGPITAADIAQAIALPASHVSAQLTRLVADGLTWRTQERGHYAVAPLLARWIARRAARDAHYSRSIGAMLRTNERSKQPIGSLEDGVVLEGIY